MNPPFIRGLLPLGSPHPPRTSPVLFLRLFFDPGIFSLLGWRPNFKLPPQLPPSGLENDLTGLFFLDFFSLLFAPRLPSFVHGEPLCVFARLTAMWLLCPAIFFYPTFRLKPWLPSECKSPLMLFCVFFPLCPQRNHCLVD